MSKNIIGTALAHYICPICGKSVEEVILMNKRLTEKDAKHVEEFNNKAIGFSDNACEECAAHKDECIYIIEIDAEKSEPNNLYRTGMYYGVRKDFNLFIDHPEYILKTKNDVQYCFMDKNLLIK